MELFVILLVIIVVSLLMIAMGTKSMERSKNYIIEKTDPGMTIINSQLEQMGFKTTREIAVLYLAQVYNLPVEVVRVDSQSKRIAICNYETSKFTCYRFDEILGCELVEDHNVICGDGVARALVGGVIAGGVGAIVGSNTTRSEDIVHSLTVRVITTNVDNPQIVMEVLESSRKKNVEYQPVLNHAREIYSIFSSIILSRESH